MLTALVLQLIQCVVALPTQLNIGADKRSENTNNVRYDLINV